MATPTLVQAVDDGLSNATRSDSGVVVSVAGSDGAAFLAIEGAANELAEARCLDEPFSNTLAHHSLPDDRRVLDAIEHDFNY